MLSTEQLQVLPKRLNPLEPKKFEKAMQHPVIRKWLSENKRFAIVHAGRRAYKTELSKRRLVAEALKNPGTNYFAAAPTYKQAKAIFWQDLKQMSPSIFVKEISESDLTIKYFNDSMLMVVGMDVPARVEGRIWHGCCLDEMGNMPGNIDIFETHIRPLLADTHGWALMIGVSRHDSNQYYKRLSDYARMSGDESFGDYSWSSEDFLDAEEIAQIKALTDPDTYKQEYGGLFVERSGLVYKYYDSDVHVKPVPLNKNLPVVISCDFNISPCVFEIAQIFNDDAFFVDEIVERNTTTWDMSKAVKLWLIKQFGDLYKSHKIIFVGDYSSSSRRDVGAVESSWQILREEFAEFNAEFQYQRNPIFMDGVNALNRQLRSADDKVHMRIDDKCKYLQNDLGSITWDMVEKDIQGDYTHAVDCAKYLCVTLINQQYGIVQG